MLLLLLGKGIDIFFEIRNTVDQNEIVNLLISANRHFPGKWIFWYVCLVMIVSIDTIKVAVYPKIDIFF